MLGKIEGGRRRVWQRLRWLDGITDSKDVSLNSGSWWWTGKPGVLRSLGLQRVGHDWVTELNWTGIPSPPPVLFVVMLPKAHLTSHSRLSGSRWVITPSWLSGSLRPFFWYSSVFSHHLSLISSASVRSVLFMLFVVPFLAWNVPLVSLIFLKRSLVFPFYCWPPFLCIIHLGSLSYLSLLFFRILHSNGYIFPFLLCFQLTFFSQLFVNPPQAIILPFYISFSWGWFWSLRPVQCCKAPSLVLQALYQI